MAESTSNIANGRITYEVSPDGKIQIQSVAVSTGFISGFAFGSNDIDTTINNFIANVRGPSKIGFWQEAIQRNNIQIASLNANLNSPAALADPSNPAIARVREQLASLTATNQNYQASIDSANAAIASVQSQGPGIIASLQQQQQSSPPQPTSTITDTTQPANTAPTGTNTLQGTASDDSGAQPTTPVTGTTTGTTPTAPPAGTDPSTNAPATPNTERETTPAANDTQGSPPFPNEEFLRLPESAEDRPGKRLKNPLTFMSSFNYQLSLYVITPDAYDAFLANGRRNINVFAQRVGESVAASETNRQGGAFLLAQSGGAGPDPRAPGVKYDYYIDNLSFTHFASSKETNSPTGNIEFSFQIIEPYGFSFISNLKKAQAQFDEFAKGTGAVGDTDAARFSDAAKSTVPTAKQFFILGIRFYGWDAAGRAVLGDETFEGSVLDPDNLGTGAIFETFYELVVYEIRYKIDGKATVYNIKANAASPSLGAGIKKGFITSPIQAKGSTVRSYLSGPEGLITKLNEEQQNLKTNGSVEYPTTYKIRWLAADAESIAQSSIVSETRTSKANQPTSQATNTEQVTPAAETTATPNANQVEIAFAKDTPIIQAIDTLFARSKYIEDMLTENYTDSSQFNPETNTAETATTPKTPFKWFRITPEISSVKWDTILNDWSYDITYVIETYLVPIVDSPFVAGTTNYYGPHKRYDYWYTGENSEVISYSQELNNQFYQEQPAGNPQSQQTPETGGNANRVAQAPNTTRSLDQSTAGGTLSTAAAAAVKNALYDPGSYTKATVEIMGDPDYLMQESTAGLSGLNQAYSRYYGAGFTIKPTGGQVFFEIDFKEAVDYSANEVSDLAEDGRGVTGVGGTLSINDSILFWDYPAGARDVVKGISYTLTKVKNSFRNGLFTQTLEAFINDFGTGALNKDARQELEAARQPAGERTSTGGTSSAEAGTTAFGTLAEGERARGTTTDPAPGTGQPAQPAPAPTTPAPEPTS
jgi:hypothetical protein